MLVSIYYSEKRDNIVLIQLTKKDGKLMVNSGLHPNQLKECHKDELYRSLLEKEYELIGFYNE